MATVWAILLLLYGFFCLVSVFVGPIIIARRYSDNRRFAWSIVTANILGLALLVLPTGGAQWLAAIGLLIVAASWALAVFGTKVGWKRIVRAAAWLILIGLVGRTFLIQVFGIVGAADKPTLYVGDYVLVSKYSYGYSKFSVPLSPPLFSGRIPDGLTPERGDIVIYRPPQRNSEDYVSRLVGLPGDRIQMLGGALYLNGMLVRRERAPDFVEVEKGVRSAPTKRWKETLPNGRSYYTLDLVDNGFADNTQVYIVPPGEYFMLGDNRDNATDSRFKQVGFVPFENLIGKAQLTVFSLHEGESARELLRWPVSVRWDRLMTVVR